MKHLFVLFFFLGTILSAQENKGAIFFAEYLQAGSIVEETGGTAYGGTLNLQSHTNLFTARYIYHDIDDKETTSGGFAQPQVQMETQTNLHEIGLLYGKRFVKRGHSYSFSAGVSYNSADVEVMTTISATATTPFSQQIITETDNYVGVPLEFNIKWFKKKKSPYRIAELFPIGEDTALGNSIGFKLFGTISQNSLIGFGITIGIGSHKYYE